MLFKKSILDGIANGTITLAFRRWRRATVKAGGTLQTPVGMLAIKSVDPISVRSITTAAAAKAGFGSKGELLNSLGKRAGRLYRIQFERMCDDPRIVLRADNQFDADSLAELKTRLARLDARSAHGAWTISILKLISKHPEVRAVQLAAHSKFDKEWLKTNIRKLKNLGLTESMNAGYRLSPRGQAFLKCVDQKQPVE